MSRRRPDAATAKRCSTCRSSREPQGKRVVVFRGDGGRELLADELTARGALVEYATCYRRARPGLDPAPLLAAWAARRVSHAVTVTSSEGLRNLCEMVGRRGTGAARADAGLRDASTHR